MTEAKLAGFSWIPSDEEVYENSLNVLPPAGMRAGMFLLGEPIDHCGARFAARYRVHRHRDGEFFVGSRPITKAEFAQL